MTDQKTEFATCEMCDVTSSLPEHFRIVRKGKRGQVLLCPSCLAEHFAAKSKRSFKYYLMIGLAGVIVFAFAEISDVTFKTSHSQWVISVLVSKHLLLIPICAIVAWVVFTVLHELSHACAGLLMGMRVFSIVIGWYGKSLVDFDLFGCNIVN